MNQGGKIGRVRVQPAILKYFSEVPGEEIWIDDLVNSTPFDEKQIQSAITRLIANGYDVRTVMRGRSWSYHGLRKPTKTANPERPVLPALPSIPEIATPPPPIYK